MENNFPKIENAAIDWNDLKYFLAVARAGGLSPAAASLRTSPSTVSRHITSLESQLGAKLFLRQQTGYLLTDAGSEMLEHIQHAEAAMLAVERKGRFTAEEHEITGLVRLATTEMLAAHLITPHLAEFFKAHPKMQVELMIGITQADLSRREADLALRLTNPLIQDDSQDYIAHQVSQLHFGVYCASGILTAQQANDPATWKKLNYISWGEKWKHLLMVQWITAAFPGKAPIVTANSLQTQYVAVQAGLGVAILPRFVGDGDPQLQRLTTAQPLSLELWLVYHRDLKASQRVAAMRDFIVELIEMYLTPKD